MGVYMCVCTSMLPDSGRRCGTANRASTLFIAAVDIESMRSWRVGGHWQPTTGRGEQKYR